MPEDKASVSRQEDQLPLDFDVPSARTGRFDALRSRWDVLLVISAGGALGSLARWGVGELPPWSAASCRKRR